MGLFQEICTADATESSLEAQRAIRKALETLTAQNRELLAELTACEELLREIAGKGTPEDGAKEETKCE